MPERDDARGRAREYVDAAQTVSFPPSRPIGEAPHEPERALLLYCPKQGGWQSGEWKLGEWTDTLTREEVQTDPLDGTAARARRDLIKAY